VAPWVGLFGVLFDQQSGLFFAGPVYVLAIRGIMLLWRRSQNLAIVCGLVFASVYLVAGCFGVWYGGLSSPARLLTPTGACLGDWNRECSGFRGEQGLEAFLDTLRSRASCTPT
jgi:hypothetical protein